MTKKVDIKINRDPYPCIKTDSLVEIFCSILEYLSELIERVVLLKRSPFGYWNNVKSSLRIIPSFWVSIIVLCLLGHGGLYNDLEKAPWLMLTTFGAVFGAYYFAERTSYYNKWSHLAQLYIDVMKAKPLIPGTKIKAVDTFSYRSSLEMALAHDILVMEMWSHSSFTLFFRETMIEVVSEHNKTLIDDADCVNKLNGMKRKEILDMIETCHNNYTKAEIEAYRRNMYSSS